MSFIIRPSQDEWKVFKGKLGGGGGSDLESQIIYVKLKTVLHFN